MNTILTNDAIRLSGSASTKEEAIAEVGAILVSTGAVTSEYVDAMFARESSVSTYMGNLLAIPHGTNDSKDYIKHSAIAVVRYDSPLDWDGHPVRFVIGIAGQGDSHLEVLGNIAMVFSDLSAVDALISADTVSDVANILGKPSE